MPSKNPLALDEQVCFALTVAAREVIAAYRPVLAPLGLTHPQYLVMLALWEQDGVPIKDLCRTLSLEPATLTPLLKRLEHAGLLDRRRATHDERSVEITLTDQGHALRDQARAVPGAMLETFGMDVDELAHVNALLRDLVGRARQAEVPA